ncbi:hypothetical protein Tco_0274888, partial [Tanacetum coccineum]
KKEDKAQHGLEGSSEQTTTDKRSNWGWNRKEEQKEKRDQGGWNKKEGWVSKRDHLAQLFWGPNDGPIPGRPFTKSKQA